jgi:acetyl-CoA carboxylase biotin carboxyl carrier protein
MPKKAQTEKKKNSDELDLKKIMEVLGETDVTEFDYSKDDLHIVLKKEPVAVMMGEDGASRGGASAEDGDESAGAGENAEAPKSAPKILKSPAVGTFHISDGDTLLASVGKKVKKGKKLGWVNSMGIAQEIMADTDLKITAIFCKDREVVEWGQKLFEIEEENV